MTLEKAVVMGASAGGLKALSEVFQSLPEDLATAVFVVLHIQARSGHQYAQVLQHGARWKVSVAQEKEVPELGHIYMAPPGYHLLVEADQSLSLSVDERVHYCRPAIDVLFESAARSFRDRLVGVLLTGANQDGTDGLRAIQKFGGWTIAQDPSDAEVSDMPASAVAAGVVDQIEPLGKIVGAIVDALEKH